MGGGGGSGGCMQEDLVKFAKPTCFAGSTCFQTSVVTSLTCSPLILLTSICLPDAQVELASSRSSIGGVMEARKGDSRLKVIQDPPFLVISHARDVAVTSPSGPHPKYPQTRAQ